MPTHKQHAALRKGRSHPKAQALKQKMIDAANRVEAKTKLGLDPLMTPEQSSEALPEWVTPPYPQQQ